MIPTFAKITDAVSPCDDGGPGSGKAEIIHVEPDDSGKVSYTPTGRIVQVRNEHDQWFNRGDNVTLYKDAKGIWCVRLPTPKT